MARNLSAAVIAAINAGTVRPVVFFEGVYSTGTLRLWSGTGPYTWNGQTWTGAGQMLGLAPITEVSHVQAVGFAVSLTGDAAAILSINLGSARQGLAGRVWLGVFDASGSLIADPFKAFEGRLDVPEIFDEGERCTITVSYESRLIDLDRTRERRYTNEDQHIDYPTDDGFEYVESLQDMTITWGRPGGAPVAAPPGPSSGGGHAPGVEAGESYGGSYDTSAGSASDPVGAINDAAPGSFDKGLGNGEVAAAIGPEQMIDSAAPGSISMGVTDSAAATDFGASTPGNTPGDASAYGGDFAGVGGGVGEGGGGGESGGKVICTELHRQGLMPDAIFEADQRYGARQPRELLDGYHAWAKPVVARMRLSRAFTRLVWVIASPWAREMAYREQVLERGSWIGALLMAIGEAYCIRRARRGRNGEA